MAELANVLVERQDGVQLVRLSGEVDISNAGQLVGEISDAVPNDAIGLVLDLSGTTYLDSAGIRMLFELSERTEGRRQSLAIVVPADSLIRHSLTITEVAQAMAMHETEAEAVAAIRTE